MAAPWLIFAAFLILVLLAGGWAQASSLEVQPVVIELPAPAQSAVLTVMNRGTRATTVQIRSFAWSQAGNADLLSRTSLLFTSPPIAEIAPGASQIFRILLRRPAVETETAYRLLLDELPEAGPPGLVRMALRISLPVFAKPETSTRADLRWRTEPAGPDGVEIVAVNRGTEAEKIFGLRLILGNARPIEAAALPNAWILPGAERHFHVDLPHPTQSYDGTAARLTGHLRASTLDVAAPFSRAE